MTTVEWAAAADAVALVIVDDMVAEEAGREIGGDDGHHLQRVRRLTVGEVIVVADGRGRWYRARVGAVGAGTLHAERIGPSCIEPEPAPALTVAFAPARSDHGTGVVHELVEMGVDRIIPLTTQRAVVRWTGVKGTKAWERLHRVAREAAMQCRRARVPVVESPRPLSGLVGETGLIVADREGRPIGELPDPVGGSWCAVVGPEGGLTADELALLGEVDRLAVGPHVVRSVTAPVAVAAVLATRTILVTARGATGRAHRERWGSTWRGKRDIVTPFRG